MNNLTIFRIFFEGFCLFFSVNAFLLPINNILKFLLDANSVHSITGGRDKSRCGLGVRAVREGSIGRDRLRCEAKA